MAGPSGSGRRVSGSDRLSRPDGPVSGPAASSLPERPAAGSSFLAERLDSGPVSPPVPDRPPPGSDPSSGGPGRHSPASPFDLDLDRADDARELRSGPTPTDQERTEGAGVAGPGRSASRLLPGPGAFDPGRRGVRALAVAAAVVVLIAGGWAWRSRPHAEPVRPVVAAASDEPPPSPPGPSASAQLVVAVAGKVRRPGLVRLPAGARVADAVEAAGGALPGVDTALLNPARKVADGELILVGVAAPPGQAAQPGQPAAGGGAAPGSPVNLNTATLAQLDALPGVGPVLAQRILDHREQHGGFRSVSDLRQVEGIGDARYEQLKDLVTV
ncbi:helix-hairpin-helix domain-containing protein [Micromonospora solifontis]|uniref:helix-hairpin-helix domain-containing protein n=1 Tax=Micromonospora TaxID=1873 RepID=UPI00359F7F6D